MHIQPNNPLNDQIWLLCDDSGSIACFSAETSQRGISPKALGVSVEGSLHEAEASTLITAEELHIQLSQGAIFPDASVKTDSKNNSRVRLKVFEKSETTMEEGKHSLSDRRFEVDTTMKR